ncbi:MULTISPECIES: hydantoinase/oxoprolinase family protein [unclassified Acidisoma]|uniref:hydantoinase/oxoprolinase family protein n=1 Tax=unclassified Acidisoma TaxID=2634065 RepID=UPI00131CFC2A|nr:MULTISPECIES: hydantoinase/oxoprolinase family protein [unclassified Acidisoma]
MAFQICIDIGGTFTDCLVADESGEIRIFKAPTTPGAFHLGFIDVLHVAAAGLGLEPRDFIAAIETLVHGSTVSTNALVEGKVARTGVLLNEGHQDILVLREGPRKRGFEWRLDYPDPFVPRALTRTVGGRIDARGRELVPLAEADVHAAIAHLRALNVEALAVGLLWSVVNPSHELRVGEILKREWPELPVTLSHEVNPIPREYRRIIAAAIDASISPTIRRYIAALQEALDGAGFTGELLLANCLGGMMPVAEMLGKPIYSVMSGPTLAPMAALALSDESDIIVGDMGGTTFDVSALRDHQIIVTPESMINKDLLGIPKVDVRSVGAGGGSIAFVDDGGLLHVGPRSAGARPGPACYGAGGTEPTVTDANVVLGIIDPDYFLAGRITLNRALAEQAVGRVAERLGIGLLDAAYAIHTTSNHNMVAAIEEITVREGINPRDSYFVCGGGGTACHVAEMADILGLRRYMVPRFMAGLSAFGGLISDIRWERNGVCQTNDRDFDFAAVNALLARLRQEGEAFLEAARVEPSLRSYVYSFQGRYEYQSWEIEVGFDAADGIVTPAQLPELVEAFHRMHERIYAIRSDRDVVEFTTWKVRANGARRSGDAWKRFEIARQDSMAKPKSERPLFIQEAGGLQTVPVYDGAKLGRDAAVHGPCLIETETFTAVLKRQHTARMDRFGNLLVEVA